MLIENKGIKIDNFYIPPFDLNVGEIVVLYLFNGQHFYETEMFLKDIFCGKTKDENVIVNKNLTFVEHFIEPKLRRLFYPVTVGNQLTKLYILELQLLRHRRLDWVISPAKGTCLFWINKWTEHGLFIIYNDSMTNYALKVQISKKPNRIFLEVTELGEMICIKKNWTIGFKFYTDKEVSLFDLKKFQYLPQLTEEQANLQNYVPTEQGENNERLD